MGTNLEKIEHLAFSQCTALEEIYIPDSVKELEVMSPDRGPFYSCYGLKRISIGGIDTITNGMIATGSQIESLTIRGSVRNIGANAFYYFYRKQDADQPFAELVIEEGVEEIGSSAFYGCSGFSSASIPSSVKVIGEKAFYNCSNINFGNLTLYVETINESAFWECRGITSIKLIGTKTIKNNAFGNCFGLKTIDFGTSLEKIETGAFYQCIALEEVYLPDSVKELEVQSPDRGPFYGCWSLTILIDYNNVELAQLLSSVGLEYEFSNHQFLLTFIDNLGNNSTRFYNFGDKIELATPTWDQHVFAGWYEDETFTVPWVGQTMPPHDLTLYAGWDFNVFTLTVKPMNGENPTEYTFASGNTIDIVSPTKNGYVFAGWALNEIGDEPFDGIMPAENITIYARWKEAAANGNYEAMGDHVALIGYVLLEEESKTVYLPDQVDGMPLTVISSGAFSNSQVEAVFIPASVMQIEQGAFSGSDTLSAIHISSDNPVYKSIDGVVYNKDGTKLIFCPPTAVKHVNVPNGVTEIGPYAFDGTAISSVTLPQTLTKIGERAFRDTAIYQIVLPESLTEIGERAFSGCRNLTMIEAKGSPAVIGEYAFSGINPFALVSGPDEDCALRTAIRGMGYMYNGHTMTLHYSGQTRIAFLQSGAELMLPENPDMGENRQFIGWYLDEAQENVFEDAYMPNDDLELWAGANDILTYETVETVIDEETTVTTLKITGCNAIGSTVNIPENIGGVSVTALAAGSFGDQYEVISVPATVTEIADGAFGENAVIVCVPGSYAEAWAAEHQRDTKEKTWTLAWNTGFEAEIESIQLHGGDAIALPALTRSGYALVGWFWDDALTEALEETVMPGHNAVLYAAWEMTDSDLASLLNDLTWEEEENSVIITGYIGNESELTIPSDVNGKPVSGIGIEAFAYNGTLTSVTLPDCVATMGSHAFYAMRSLQIVNLPASLTEIPSGAFASCSALRQIILPEGILTIEKNAFDGTGLTGITLPASLTSIDSTALMNCGNLASINVADGNEFYESRNGVLYDIADGVLVKYPAAKTDTSYTVENDAWSIGAWAFKGADQLTEIIFGDDIYSLGEGAISQCSNLTVMPQLGSMVTRIPDQCFYGCAALEDVTIPASIKQIGSRAFANTGITELTMPDSVTSIGNQAFNSSILLRGSNNGYAKTWAQENGVSFLPTGSAMIEALAFETEEIIMERGERLQLILNATPVDASLTGVSYFTNDTSVAQVDERGILYAIGGGSTMIYASAPGGALAICAVTVKVSVTQIQLNVENVELTVGESLQLEATILPEKATDRTIVWSASKPGIVFVNESGQIFAIGNGTVTVQAAASSGAFAECNVSVRLPDGAFILPSALYQIDEETFVGNAMVYTAVPEGCTVISNRAFADCVSLRLIRLPASVVSIAEDAFQGCGQITIIAPRISKAHEYAEANSFIFIPAD